MFAKNTQIPSQLLTTALGHLQAGRYAEAEAGWRQALAAVPDHANASYNLAVTLKAQGRLDEAAAQYLSTLRLKPDNAKAHNNLGVILEAQGRLEDAAEHYARAVAIQPDHANAHYNLANVQRQRGEFHQAILHYRAALLGKPNDAETHNNLGIALAADGQPAEATPHYRRALALRPGYAQAYSNLGSALEDKGQVADAIDCYRKALTLKPDYPDAHYNLGHALQAQDRLTEAEAAYHWALALDPVHAKAHNNFGFLAQLLGRVDEALARYRRAQELDPNYADAHWNEALARLLLGDFAAGWRKYEWRWRRKETPPRVLGDPLWDGGGLAGKTILLHAEQGQGDAIQFVRYAPLVKARGGTVILECPRGLQRLFGMASGVDRLVAAGGKLPEFDCHAPLLSLPALFGTTLETIPGDVPYLKSDPDRVEAWRKRLAGAARLKVGLAWRGNPAHSNDRRRSIAAETIALLTRDSPVDWVSLQVDTRSEELVAFAPGSLLDAGKSLGDWADTAALIEALDLVVTVDTSVAHLAGALGKPVWVLLPFAPDWRWMLERWDSPWYSTMRLLRQPEPDAWAPVLDQVRGALAGLAAGNSAAPTAPFVHSSPRRLPPALVVSHERSGTHFLMNALSYAYGYTAYPRIDLDTHAFPIDFADAGQIAASLDSLADERLYRLVKSHHAAAILKPALKRTHDDYSIFMVYRDPVPTMISLWRHLNGIAWDEGPKTADPLALAVAAPSGKLTRYQAGGFPTMLARWAAHVEGWLKAAEANPRIVPVRYEDLDANYERTVTSFSAIVGRQPSTPFLRPPRDINVIAMGESVERTPAAAATIEALRACCRRHVGPLMARLGY